MPQWHQSFLSWDSEWVSNQTEGIKSQTTVEPYLGLLTFRSQKQCSSNWILNFVFVDFVSFFNVDLLRESFDSSSSKLMVLFVSLIRYTLTVLPFDVEPSDVLYFHFSEIFAFFSVWLSGWLLLELQELSNSQTSLVVVLVAGFSSVGAAENANWKHRKNDSKVVHSMLARPKFRLHIFRNSSKLRWTRGAPHPSPQFVVLIDCLRCK